MSELLELLDGADLYPPAFDSDLCWRDDAAPATPLRVVPKRSLRDHLQGVDLILAALDQLDELDESDGLTPERETELASDLISALAGTREKVDNVNRVLAMFEGLEAAAAKETERLKLRAARFERQRIRLQDYVIATMTASNLRELAGNTSDLKLRQNPASVRIDDVRAVPDEFLRQPPVPAPVPDKTLIGRALKAGRAIAGATLQTTTRLVRQ